VAEVVFSEWVISPVPQALPEGLADPGEELILPDASIGLEP